MSFLKNKSIQITIHVIIPILFGGLIYISFRSKSLNMFNWFESIGVLDNILMIRNGFYELKESIPKWLYFSFPDALWVYSFTSALLLSGNEIKSLKHWLLIPFILGPFLELLQLINLFPGTFDLIDLIFTSLSYILSILIFNYKNKKNDKKKQTF